MTERKARRAYAIHPAQTLEYTLADDRDEDGQPLEGAATFIIGAMAGHTLKGLQTKLGQRGMRVGELESRRLEELKAWPDWARERMAEAEAAGGKAGARIEGEVLERLEKECPEHSAAYYALREAMFDVISGGRVAELYLDVLEKGLVGWRGLVCGNGEELPFSKSNIASLAADVVMELGPQVLAFNTLTRADRGN